MRYSGVYNYSWETEYLSWYSDRAKVWTTNEPGFNFRQGDSYLPQNVQNGSGANPASSSARTRGYFPGVKLPWHEVDLSPAHSVEVQNGTVLPLPQMSSWHAQQARGVQHQLQICLHPLGICKISKTNMPISPLKHVRQTTASTCCLLNRHGWKQPTFKNVCVCQMF